MAFPSKRSRIRNRGTQLSEAQLEHVRGGAAQAQPTSDVAMVGGNVNPLYVGSEADGTNPLFE